LAEVDLLLIQETLQLEMVSLAVLVAEERDLVEMALAVLELQAKDLPEVMALKRVPSMVAEVVVVLVLLA
jgi:hypothetical protein